MKLLTRDEFGDDSAPGYQEHITICPDTMTSYAGVHEPQIRTQMENKIQAFELNKVSI